MCSVMTIFKIEGISNNYTLQPFRAIFKCLKRQRYFYCTFAFFTYE